MANLTVEEDGGGDYTTLDEACDNIGATETITIQGAWDNPDTRAVIVSTDCNITATGAARISTSKHVAVTPTHYRLRVDSAGTHCITVDDSPTTIDGIEVWQKSASDSDEAIRMAHAGGTLTVKNAIVVGTKGGDAQDGIYAGAIAATINCENVIVYNHDRAGFHAQMFSGTNTQTWNINSCCMYNCGNTDRLSGGGITVARNITSGATYFINVHNSWSMVYTGGADFNENGSLGSATWGISYSIDSDNSIAGVDGGGAGNQASRTIADSDQGEGSYVIVNDITGVAPFDLSLLSLGNTKNNAEDEHTTDTAEGLTILGTDIDGTSRPQNANHDVGAHEIVFGSPWYAYAQQ